MSRHWLVPKRTFAYFCSDITSQSAKASMMQPWPASPNMTANKNGNVAIVKAAGLTSRYVLLDKRTLLNVTVQRKEGKLKVLV